ncbi:MAG: TIGR03751 family conjugal transfer lipoprotein [Gammaproteobacteria bacterium]|nr:TIGR03751 family conjugal transfer lipoprotein [Gammaproteobacteria bacterium]MDE0410802.1 TIGR03751 family conjugal transfer lipoprotein [Gammaproteobacteria bacterium]
MKRTLYTRMLPLLAAVLTSLQLAACTTTKEAVLSQDGPTMKAIYDRHMSGLQHTGRTPGQGVPLADTGIAYYRGFVREAARELETRFPRLPNPTLVMYVYPHLSGPERSPVPGYVTTFPFYARIEYALPGEIRAVPATSRPVDDHPAGTP